MQGNINLSLATTASGMIGGVSKAISENLTLCSINLQGVIDVGVYAVVSASVGYLVKIGIDSIRKNITNNKTKR